MDGIREEMSLEGPTLKLKKKILINVTKQEIWHTRKRIYGFSGLEKINSIAYLEVKLLGEKFLAEVKN